MEILRYFLIIIEVLCCLMLIGVILLQQSKSQGMGLAFGGGMGESLFGSRAGNVLTKTTVILSLIFLVNTTILGILYTSRSETSLVESAPAPAQNPVAPAAPANQGGMLTTPPAQEQAPLMTMDQNPTTLTPDVAPVESAPVEVAPVEIAPSEVVVQEPSAPVVVEEPAPVEQPAQP